MTVLVIGGTGKVGPHLVQRLRTLAMEVRVLVRSADRVGLVPAGVEAVAAAIVDDPDGARAAFEGVDQVFMLNRPTLGEVVEGVFAVELARAAGVRRFVYQSVFEAQRHAQLPHVASKVAIGAALKRSGMAWTILCPNHFFQNDWMTRDALATQRRYCVPVGHVGCSSVDVRDVAEAAAMVLSGSGHDGEEIPIVGPEVLTGPDCAAAWSRALGRTVTYDTTPAQWRAHTGAQMPAWLGFDLWQMYETFGRSGFVASAEDLARTTALLGRAPAGYASYVAQTAGQWSLSA